MFTALLRYKILSVIVSCIFLISCNDNKLTTEQPSSVAIQFFEAIYNKQDLHQATKLATPQYARILESYYSVERVQKVLFNRRYDQVTIEEDRNLTGISIKENHSDKAYITLMFDGLYGGNRFRDLKQVVMVKHQGKWLVDKLKADVYR